MWGAVVFWVLPLFACLYAVLGPFDSPVCIVGAGPAGLTAAHKLESKGYRTTIFEKQAEVGGKCQAYYENGLFHPLGALIVSNASYPETLKVIDAVNAPIVPFQSGAKWKFNITTSATHPGPPRTASAKALLADEVTRYIGIWEEEFAPINAISYKKGVPAKFTVTTAEWLSEHGFKMLPALMVRAMVGYGYGDLRQVPILYILQYLTPDLVTFFAGYHEAYLIDYHNLWKEFSKRFIRGPVHLAASIKSVDRSGELPIIHYSQRNNQEKACKCSALVLAFPPVLSALRSANLDISVNERTAFSPVSIINYFSGAIRVAIPFNMAFTAQDPAPHIPADANGEPVSFFRIYNTSDVATVYSWDARDLIPPVEEARATLMRTLSGMNKDPRASDVIPTPLTEADIREFRRWDYFPHYDQAHLAAGWYDKLNALQGQLKTYYASGLNGFETVELAVQAGKDVADSYFEPRTHLFRGLVAQAGMWLLRQVHQISEK